MPGVQLFFMQSIGRPRPMRTRFQGKDAILSGPGRRHRRHGAHGAARPGFDKVIGFDMGGTSTDVSHYAGEFERAFETQVAGVRMRAPMMSIHTVAAGGGSILALRRRALPRRAATAPARTRARPATGAAGRSR